MSSTNVSSMCDKNHVVYILAKEFISDSRSKSSKYNARFYIKRKKEDEKMLD